MQEPQLFETSVDCGALGELDCHVWFYYTPAQSGRYSGPPEDCYPDEPEEVEITKLEWPCDNGYLSAQIEHLDPDTVDSLMESCAEQAREAIEEAHYEAAERRGEPDDA